MQVVIQIYGRKKCKTTRKAQRFFSERGLKVQFVDLDQHTPGRREIELFLQAAGEDHLLDTDGAEYQKRGLGYMAFDPAEEIAEHPALMRTPIVRDGNQVIVGDNQTGWSGLAEGNRR